ncbi:Threonine--tRNA ligase [Candidatus Annandia adelgestsuga]|uniref:Threonine--tRNA ligase n=1 Tax=Candidatus Annandia adelgestsuga TaxID=1302411 RepID=A0A3S9J7Q7_9ENTR|nr:threonine--tRNA ligase [Candidatus Annandia adelgestsuga]AZP36401.1 Threonine--tRNA ligase [Candidatus Annandia adelgestsuga]
MPIVIMSDGTNFIYDNTIKIKKVIKKINKKLLKKCISVKINGKLTDINDYINKNVFLEIINNNNHKYNIIIRKSCAYILGYVMKRKWNKIKMLNFKITPNGFYYDIDLNHKITFLDLIKIEKKMKNYIINNFKINKFVLDNKKIIKLFLKNKEIYKINILNKYIKNNNKFYFYNYKKYFDISNIPLIINTKFCNNFKLNKVSNIYSKCNKKKYLLQRIYGKIKINNNLSLVKNKNINKIYDHRIISKKLDLYHIEEETPGSVFWHNNGLIIFNEIKSLIKKKLKKYEYQEIQTPIIMNIFSWKKTGHWKYYKDFIFTTNHKNIKYCIKPMNCPGHIHIFKKNIKSYKNLPFKVSEFGICHRHESSGSLYGLMRLRSFTQDDAHIFCNEKQIQLELKKCINMLYEIYKIFGFNNIKVKFSSYSIKEIKNNYLWKIAEKHLIYSLKKKNIKFKFQKGEGAFYGPKIEFILSDSFNREWQCGTIQLDFYLSKRLNCFYINKKNKKIVPIIIHRAILGSIERFIGILIEEYQGNFPLWLTPIQIIVINVNKKNIDYAKEINDKFNKDNLRSKIDIKNESICSKIKKYILLKIPYIVICGEKEFKKKTISVRDIYGNKQNNINLNLFKKKIKEEIINYEIK